VFLVRACFDNKLYAMKRIPIDGEKAHKYATNEIRILKLLSNNPYVIKFHISFFG